MSTSLRLYRAGARLLEPAAPMLLKGRLKRGKERPGRISERLGHATVDRPPGELVWMHGASVGECGLLLDLYAELQTARPGLRALITSQTLTAADMVAARGGPAVIHQMAAIDAPKFVTRFLDHWHPDLIVFAEGEIWPNMLSEIGYRWIPAGLVNARMTQKTLAGWRSRRTAAKSLFTSFRFIGAADQATAMGLGDILHRRISVVGNLKQATGIAVPDAEAVQAWRTQVGDRPVLLAASTHPGEDELAFEAFAKVRDRHRHPLLIVVPRHPDRGAEIALLAAGNQLAPQTRALDALPPGFGTDVLVADTMGELLFWYAACDGVYLGGAHAKGVGGHNPFEPVQLGKRVATGPHGFNFSDAFARLEGMGLVVQTPDADALAAFWMRCLEDPAYRTVGGPEVDALFAAARAPLDATLAALLEMPPPDPTHA